ncbi:MAG: RHS repeat-associated core domain-containing protein, partial [Anaerolineae bacterium]|nr:RHS repeat-associated core domain-containing protein [Anaerolineae bacterium]
TGAVTGSREWSPFGVESGGTETGLGYTGEWQDAYAGLVYLRARWLDVQAGRFTSKDLWEGVLQYPKSLQPWLYAYASPINYTDPSGQCVDEDLDGVCDDPVIDFVYAILARWGGVNDLEAMARICDMYARLYPDWHSFLGEMSLTLLGVESYGPGTLVKAVVDVESFVQNGTLKREGCSGFGREPRDCKNNNGSPYFGDEGFHLDYQDGHNQPYHVWGFIAETAFPLYPEIAVDGICIGHAGNIFHDIVQSRRFLNADNGYGASWQDYFLSHAGMEIGTAISIGVIPSPKDLCQVLRDRLGTTGPGSCGAVQWWEEHWDIAPLAE